MDDLILEGQINTPSINFNSETGVLKMFGRSIPENPLKFYQPIENWIAGFILSNPSNIELHIHLDYLNTHSTECILILIKKIEAFTSQTNTNAKIVWSFDQDDEDMQDLGEDLSTLISIPFEYKEVVDED